MAKLRSIIAGTIEFAQAWFSRFVGVQGFDRAMALAAQSFSALIPIMMIYGAAAPGHDGQDLADEIVDKFDLTGSAAATVHDAFQTTQDVSSTITVLGVFFILVSALSFSRGMQRLYEGSYGFSTLGVRNTRRGLTWVCLIVAYIAIRPLVADVFTAPAWKVASALTLAFAAWTTTPYLLLGKRLGYRALLPGALLAAFGMTALSLSSLIWFPASLTASAQQFGAMGIAFALLSWLFAAGVVLVVAATGGAVINEHFDRRHP